VIEQVLDRQVVDELARELRRELRRIHGRRQAGRAPEIGDRAQRRADRLHEPRGGCRVDLVAPDAVGHRLRRRLHARERRRDARDVPAQVQHELGERVVALERVGQRRQRQAQLLRERGERVAIGHQGAPGLV
jgi:hypothetical protein